MLRASQTPQRQRHWLLTVLAFVAITAQLVVAFAPLTEGREPRLASHIEAPGNPTHVNHNDATCAACQARSIHGTTARRAIQIDRVAIAPVVGTGHLVWVASADRYLQDNPRAPPSVI